MAKKSASAFRGTVSDLDGHVEELTQETAALKDQMRLLRMALDEFHTDFQWAVRNMQTTTPAPPPFHMTSMPLEEAKEEKDLLDDETSDELPEITCSRVTAIEKFRAYLEKAGHQYRAPLQEEVERLGKGVALLPDFVVSRPAEPLLLTVRQILNRGERDDMAKWPDAFGRHFRCVQVWGRQGRHGISWSTDVIVEAAQSFIRGDVEDNEEDVEMAEPAEEIRQPQMQRRPSPARNSPMQPLYRRIMQKHMTDIVRAIRYDELSLDEAHARLAPLIETYGKEKIEEAAKELTEPIPGREGFYQLSAAARPFALQLVGRPPETSPRDAALPADQGGVPEVQLPRDRALGEFKRWLIVCGRSWSAIAPKTAQAMQHKRLLVPDGIVDGTQLVAVRQMLSPKQREDMKQWLPLFGDDYEAARVWKSDGPHGATWSFEIVATDEDGTQVSSAESTS
jgi:hypothetical protein